MVDANGTIPPAVTHGFRADPMPWVETDASVQGAMVRCSVFKTPRGGDTELIRTELVKELAKRNEEAEKGKVGTGWIDLLEVGGELGLPEVREIGRLILEKGERNDKGEFGVYCIRALCHCGFGAEEVVRASVRTLALEVPKQNPWRCCPWGPFLRMRALWYGRELANVDEALDGLVTAIDQAANQIGNVHDKDPWGLVQLGGVLEHERARGMVVRAIPVILRAQKEDGGWGDRSFNVFRALHRHGLIEPLRKLPPVPADWQIARTIPAPAKGLKSLAWDGERIWTLRRGDDAKLFAISPDDGAVLATLEVGDAKVTGVGWRKGRLLLACSKPNLVREIDPKTGEVLSVVRLLGDIVFQTAGVAAVDGRVWVCDDFCPTIWAYDPENPGKPVEGDVPTTEVKPRYTGLAGPGPVDIAVVSESVWHHDWMTPLLVRTDLDGHLLEWGEKPFAEVAGITFDGANLWVLDAKKGRLCVIEKTPDSTAFLPATHLLRDWLVCGPFPSEELSEDALAEIAAKRGDGVSTRGFRAGHSTDFLGGMGGEANARPEPGRSVTRPDGSAVEWRGYETDIIRFHRAFPEEATSPSVIYGFTTVDSAAERGALLAVGSDDAVKVWLNGELVHDLQVGRGMKMDQDVVPVTLRKGANALLLKVENTGGRGGFMARFVRRLPGGAYEGVAPRGE
ncbi:MAG: NHL repeat-containing protein [Planctomycetota bacterium]|jgi:hypothetical protein